MDVEGARPPEFVVLSKVLAKQAPQPKDLIDVAASVAGTSGDEILRRAQDDERGTCLLGQVDERGAGMFDSSVPRRHYASMLTNLLQKGWYFTLLK